MAKAQKGDRELLSRLLRSKLIEACPPSQIPPGMQQAGYLVPGAKMPSYGDVVVFVLLEQAANGKEWAVEQVLDRTEGKPVQAVRQEDADRSTEEMLTDVSVKHLNILAERITKRATSKQQEQPREQTQQPKLDPHPIAPATQPQPPSSTPEPENQPAGPASRLLSLPKNRSSDPQDPQGESPMANGLA